MTKGLYHHVRETWQQPKAALPHMYRQARMAQWRRAPVFDRVEKPTRIDAARRSATRPSRALSSSAPAFAVVACVRARCT